LQLKKVYVFIMANTYFFPATRFLKRKRSKVGKTMHQHTSRFAQVAQAAAIESVAWDILDKSIFEMLSRNKKTVARRDIAMSIHKSDDLKKLFKGMVAPGTLLPEHIYDVLLSKNSKKGVKSAMK